MRALLIILGLSSQIAWGALEFESDLIEVQAAADAEKAQADFNFKNTGDEPVFISHINPDCDCLTIMAKGGTKLPDGTIRYLPGETGVIRSTFKIGNDKGVIDQVTAIWLKDDPRDAPSIRLTTRIKVPKVISMTPRTLKWDVGSKPDPQRIDVVMDHDKPVHITATKSTNSNFIIRMETIEEGKHYVLWVHPDNTEHSGIAAIQVETDSPVKNQKTEQVFAMVQRPAK